MDEPRWVRLDVALAIHQRQLAEHGGSDGLRDTGLLESAIPRPRTLYAYSEPQPDIASLAAAYAAGISQNHPFIDGNKRTALAVSRTFLALNGCQLLASQQEKAAVFLALAAGEISEEHLAGWIREHLEPRLRR